MAYQIRANDYISGGSRSSSRNGGHPAGTIHIRQVLQRDLHDLYDPASEWGLQLHCFSASSQKIEQLTQTIITEHYSRGCPPNSHGYIFGGYCDISEKKRIPQYRLRNSIVFYEEVVFDHSVSDAFALLVNEITNSARRLREEGIRPCFATIPPASLERWNSHRLGLGRTALLLHEGQYQDMQRRLNTVLSNVNSFITKLNHWNDMYTPYVAGTVLRTKAKKSDQTNYILQHHKLYDGVHADDRLIEEWALKFERAIRKNRVAYRTVHYNSPLTAPLTDELVCSFAN